MNNKIHTIIILGAYCPGLIIIKNSNFFFFCNISFIFIRHEFDIFFFCYRFKKNITNLTKKKRLGHPGRRRSMPNPNPFSEFLSLRLVDRRPDCRKTCRILGCVNFARFKKSSDNSRDRGVETIYE